MKTPWTRRGPLCKQTMLKPNPITFCANAHGKTARYWPPSRRPPSPFQLRLAQSTVYQRDSFDKYPALFMLGWASKQQTILKGPITLHKWPKRKRRAHKERKRDLSLKKVTRIWIQVVKSRLAQIATSTRRPWLTWLVKHIEHTHCFDAKYNCLNISPLLKTRLNNGKS